MSASTRPGRRPRPPASGRASAAGRTSMGLAGQHAAAVARACRLIETAEEMPSLDALAETAGHQPVPLSPGVQSNDRRHPEGLCGGPPRAARAGRARAQQDRDRGDLRRRVQLQRALLRHLGEGPRHDPDGLSHRRRRRIDPLRRRRMLAGLDPRGRDRAGRLRDPARRRIPSRLVRDLQDRFPRRPARRRGQATSSAWWPRWSASSRRRRSGSICPLDVRGTAFQQRVWQALREIPAGSTASYRTSPSASARRTPCARWPGRAHRTRSPSPFPVTASCARDGSLSGYRWGVERKRALLAREKAS